MLLAVYVVVNALVHYAFDVAAIESAISQPLRLQRLGPRLIRWWICLKDGDLHPLALPKELQIRKDATHTASQKRKEPPRAQGRHESKAAPSPRSSPRHERRLVTELAVSKPISVDQDPRGHGDEGPLRHGGAPDWWLGCGFTSLSRHRRASGSMWKWGMGARN